MRTLLLRLIRVYQYTISPTLGAACRYEPSCSHYAYEAIERHGAWRGVKLTVRRLSRCRPGGGSGYDPVPPALDAWTSDAAATRDVSRETSTGSSTGHPHRAR